MLDRGLRVLLPNQARREANLPPDFFNLTAEELKREQQARFKLLFLFSTLFSNWLSYLDKALEQPIQFVSTFIPSAYFWFWPGNTREGSITLPLTSYLTGLESAVWQLNFFCFYLQNRLIQTSQTGNGTVVLPPSVFPALTDEFHLVDRLFCYCCCFLQLLQIWI